MAPIWVTTVSTVFDVSSWGLRCSDRQQLMHFVWAFVFHDPFARCLKTLNFLPQSGHGMDFLVSRLVVCFAAGADCLFRNDDRVDNEVDGVAFRAISRLSTNAMTSLIVLCCMFRVLRASRRISRSAIPARRTSLTVSVV